jgi:hypothetical protein
MAESQCPECSSTNIKRISPEIIECQDCGYHGEEFPLMVCPSCRRANDYGVDACVQCGEPMSLFWQVLSRHANPTQSLRLEQIRSQADQIKTEAFAASKERYAQFEDIDRRRIRAEREAQLARAAQDRQLFVTVGIALGIFAIIILVVALVLGAG